MKSEIQLLHHVRNSSVLNFLLVLLVVSSCTKEDVKPMNPNTNNNINTTISRISFLQANAGNDTIIYLPSSQYKLNARKSVYPLNAFDNGLQIEWSKLSGPTIPQLIAPNASITGISSLQEGIYEFEFKATCSGATSRDTIKLTVIDLNTPPNVIAFAGNDTSIILPSNSILLNGSGYTQYGTITNYSWRKIVGNGYPTITSPNSASTYITGLDVGTYMFELKVTNNSGFYATDTINITLKPKTVTIQNLIWNCAWGCSIYGIDLTYYLGPNFVIDQVYLQEPPGNSITAIYQDPQSPCLSGSFYCYWIYNYYGAEIMDINANSNPGNNYVNVIIEYH